MADTVHRVDYLIVGQGLAGTAMAWRAWQRGRSFCIVDAEEPSSSSKVAAGLMNPITGGRLNIGWRAAELWASAQRFYRDCEKTLSIAAPFFQEIPILRLFLDAEQASLWKSKRQQPDYAPFWRPLETDELDEAIQAEHGGFETRQAGALFTEAYLEGSRQFFLGLGSYVRDHLKFEDLQEQGSTVYWPARQMEARHVIWCQGHSSRTNPPFDWVPIRPGKGDILTLQIPKLEETRIINCKRWILPMPESGVFRAGSTFAWGSADHLPTQEGREEIETGLKQFLKVPYQVQHQTAGIRPMANQGRPLIGRHPQMPHHVFFNGLGAKGALLAPLCAEELLEHLETGNPLDPNVSIDRFWQS